MSYSYGDVLFVPSGSVPTSQLGSMRCANPGPAPFGVSDFVQSLGNPISFIYVNLSGMFHWYNYHNAQT